MSDFDRDDHEMIHGLLLAEVGTTKPTHHPDLLLGGIGQRRNELHSHVVDIQEWVMWDTKPMRVGLHVQGLNRSRKATPNKIGHLAVGLLAYHATVVAPRHDQARAKPLWKEFGSAHHHQHSKPPNHHAQKMASFHQTGTGLFFNRK